MEATLNDASKQSALFTNTTEYEKIINLEGTVYQDIAGKEVNSRLILPPFSSKILNYVSGNPPPSLGNLQNPLLHLTIKGQTVNISWEAQSEAAGYRLYYAPIPYTGVESIDSYDMKNKTQFSVELYSGATFYVAITAYNKLGESDYSNIGSFSIP